MENNKKAKFPSYSFSIPRLKGTNFDLVPVSPAKQA